MNVTFRGLAMLVLLASVLVVPLTTIAQDESDIPFAASEFAGIWERTDRPVAELVESRTWIWGPGPRTTGIEEEYVEAEGGLRMVQYFDKSRMEFPITGDVDHDSPWFITQGLLATELMTGRLQLGDDTFEQHQPSTIPVAGDPDDTGGPTYAVMGQLIDQPARDTGSEIVETISADGQIGQNSDLALYGVTDAVFDDVTGQNVASVFWDFMISTGTIWDGSDFVTAELFEVPIYAVGRPITPAYWAWVKVAGTEQNVLMQCFERRCLTYTPDNPDGWRVESGNIGMHYREWRYETIDRTDPGPPEVTTFVDQLAMPDSLTFAPDGRMFFNEVYHGRIRVVGNGQLREEPFATLNIARPGGGTEYGLLGLALHPDFDHNGYVYALYTVGGGGGQPVEQRIVRFTDQGNIGVDPTIIVDGLPFGPNCCHNGGRIAFGPDGMLYVTLGDIEDPATSQDPGALAGSVLRYAPNGAIPNDNPFGQGNPIYALGLRNPFGLTFHPETGDLFVTDNGPAGHDEVNRIIPGGNYGWPEVQGIAGDGRFIDPIWATITQRIAPTGITVSTDAVQVPDIAGKVLFCSWNTSELTALELADGDPNVVTSQDVLPVACQLDVVQGPDGAIYASDAARIYRYGPPGS
jgi:glucose/arabinose dehydrogenase